MLRRAAPALVLALLLCACGGGGAAPRAADAPAPPPAASAPPEPEVTPEPEAAPAPPTLEEQAAAMVSELTEEEKVGQLFFVRFPETDAARWAGEYGLGGYILFGRDFQDGTPQTLRDKIGACQTAAKIPMLMGVDEEGGTVVRASLYPAFRSEKFKSPRRVYREGGMEGVYADAVEKSAFLLALGLNVNLAPVCDVSTHKGEFIYDRAFGQGPEETAEYVKTVVSAMDRAGIGSVMKHFPGYGGNADTHTGRSRDPRPIEQFLTRDLLPFRAGAGAGAGAALVCHNVVACLNPDLPASLAPETYDLLRGACGEEVVALTDDLDMGAVGQYVKEGRAAVQAIRAGADMVLCSDPGRQLPQVLAALEAGELDPERVDEAAARVLAWKLRLGLCSYS